MQTQQKGFVYTVPSQLAPRMPREFSVSTSWFDNVTISAAAGSTQNIGVFGLFEMLNQRPFYTAQFFTLYKLCRITAVEVHFEVITTGTTPVKMVMVSCPYNESASPSEAIERPRSLYRTVGGSGGMNRGVLRRLYHSQIEQGNPVYDTSHWFNATQSVSTTPQDLNGACVKTWVSTLDGVSNWSAEISWRVTYHLQFFDLENPLVS